MDMMANQPSAKHGIFDKLCLYITGADEELMLLSPERWDNVRAVALLMAFTWLYQSALFSVISHRLFSVPGQVRPELLAVSAFLASFILLIDSYMVMRSGWHLSGIQELKRGGIDVSGGMAARVKAGIFLSIRIILSIGIAQLTAIFFSLLLFNSDIAMRLQETFLQANASLIASSTTLVDGEIQRATDALKTEITQEAALASQVAALRQNQIDPSAGDAQVQLAQREVTQLLTQKAAADQVVQQTETFASDELGGIKGSPSNSGIPGVGPRRVAAMEAVNNAKYQDQQVAAALGAAQNRLDALRSQSLARVPATEQQSHAELPSFQNMLAAEDVKLAAMKSALATQEDDRDNAIRAVVEAAPSYVPPDRGLLAQITALDQIAHQNPKITAVILLVGVTGFGFELAAVLAKVTSYVPTTYSALLARSAYMQVVRLVDEMMVELDPPSDGPRPEQEVIPPAASRDGTAWREMPSTAGTDPFSGVGGPSSAAPRRGRGRPRKTPSRALVPQPKTE